MKVCLDPGHGWMKSGRWNGARGNGLQEDTLVFKFASRLGHYLRKHGHKTVFTREDEKLVALGDRGKIAKQRKCDLFVSVHANAFSNASAHGAEVFVCAKDTGKSFPYAHAALNVLVDRGMHRRGTKTDNQAAVGSLRVLRDTYSRMPAILIELGFLTNPDDAARLKDARWLEDVACEMAHALIEA